MPAWGSFLEDRGILDGILQRREAGPVERLSFFCDFFFNGLKLVLAKNIGAFLRQQENYLTCEGRAQLRMLMIIPGEEVSLDERDVDGGRRRFFRLSCGNEAI